MADQVVQSGGAGAIPPLVPYVEPPHSFAQARVDDKGRLKLPAEFLEYLKQLGVDKVFVTTVDLELVRIYPIPMWKANLDFFSGAGELAEVAEDVAFIAKHFGGDSDIDSQGRVLLPPDMRRRMNLESAPVWLDVSKGRINVAGKAVHEARYQRAMANLNEKVKELEKKGLK